MLTHRYTVLWVALLAVVLTLPSLRAGLIGDDLYHRAKFLGSRTFGPPRGFPLDMFRFCDGDPQRTHHLMDIGFLPWWTYGHVRAAFWRPGGTPWHGAATVLGWVFIALHCIVAPLALPVRAAFPAGGAISDRFRVPAISDPAIEHQDLVLVNSASAMFVAYFADEQEARGLPAPRRVRVLTSGMRSATAYRPDEYTLVIRPADGFISSKIETLMRDESYPMTVGQRVALTGITVEVTELTSDGRPAEAVFRFAVPLEDASLRWMCWKPDGFAAFTPPPVGARVGVP